MESMDWVLIFYGVYGLGVDIFSHICSSFGRV